MQSVVPPAGVAAVHVGEFRDRRGQRSVRLDAEGCKMACAVLCVARALRA